MNPEIELYNRAGSILRGIVSGDRKITGIYTADLERFPLDSCDTWQLEIMVTGHTRLTFDMEGINIASVREMVEFDGRRLVDEAYPLAVLCGLTGQEQAALETTVLSSLSHVLPK